MKRNQLFSAVLLSLITLATSAQNPHNLVPNPSFEEVDGKIKSAGSIDLAIPWRSYTSNPVDLYSEDAKTKDFAVPVNKYGEEKAKTGVNYVGLRFCGYKGRIPRSYLGVELNSELIAEKEYCLKFHISMSDMSKYAVNNIGMYITSEDVTEIKDGNLDFKPQILSYTNKVYDQQFLWEDICGTYTAKGGEKYIIIGNFASDEDTKVENVRLSREFSGRQETDAYYFVDDVSVIAIEKIGPKDCSCEAIAGGQMSVEKKAFATDETFKPQAKKTYVVNSDGTKTDKNAKRENATETEQTEATEEKASKETGFNVEKVNLYYDNKGIEPKASEQAKIDEVVAYLKKNPNAKIEIVGHADPSESEVNFIGKRRAFAVQKLFLAAGMDDSRVSYRSAETNEPASSSDASKNQRVSFTLK